MKRFTSTIAATALALTLAACGGGGEADGSGAQEGGGGSSDGLTVTAKEFEFDPTSITIPADTPTDVTIDNQGVIEHDITVDELDLKVYATAGSSATETVTAAAGSYAFYCSIPGHRESGMEGTFTVEG